MLTRTITLPESEGQLANSVADVLRSQIESGKFKTGDWLPTERKLAEDLSVHRRTVRMAINQLVKGGLVTRQPHCRPIVGTSSASILETAATATPSTASSFIALLTSGHMDSSVSTQQRIFWGMNQGLADAGYFGVFVNCGEIEGSEEEIAAREAKQLRYIMSQGFGGVVFYPYAYHSNIALIEEARHTTPIVTLDRRVDTVDTDFVGVDNYRAMYDTIVHLAERGHRRIAYVTKNEQIPAVQDRIRGYIDAILHADLVEMVLSIPSRTEHEWTSFEAVFQLPKDRRPTAVAAFNDYSALAAFRRLKNLGLSVPEDVALTGFDSICPVLPNGVGLTSAAQPYEEMGGKAVELLIRRMNDPSAPTLFETLPARLEIRDSSQFPRN